MTSPDDITESPYRFAAAEHVKTEQAACADSDPLALWLLKFTSASVLSFLSWKLLLREEVNIYHLGLGVLMICATAAWCVSIRRPVLSMRLARAGRVLSYRDVLLVICWSLCQAGVLWLFVASNH